MREGPAGKVSDIDLAEFERNASMPITARLAFFINTITDELMEKNEQLKGMYQPSPMPRSVVGAAKNL